MLTTEIFKSTFPACLWNTHMELLWTHVLIVVHYMIPLLQHVVLER